MVKKINPNLVGIISNRERHVRINWEKSPENHEMLRYYFVVVDDKNRKAILMGLLENFFEWGDVIPIRENVEGKVTGSKLRYLFESYDINQIPEIGNFSRLRKPIKRDKESYRENKK